MKFSIATALVVAAGAAYANCDEVSFADVDRKSVV